MLVLVVLANAISVPCRGQISSQILFGCRLSAMLGVWTIDIWDLFVVGRSLGH